MVFRSTGFTRSPVRARALLACGSLLLAPLMHAALAHGRFVLPAIGAGAAQAGFLAWLALERWRPEGAGPRRWIAAILVAIAVFAAGVAALPLSLSALSGLTHTILYAALLAVFGGSLRPGRTPVVTAVARAARGPLTPELLRYTRAVTWVWAGFALAQLVLAPLLLLFTPLPVWSLFVNTLDTPAMLVLFAAEYAYRRYRFRALPRLSPTQFRQAMAAWASARKP